MNLNDQDPQPVPEVYRSRPINKNLSHPKERAEVTQPDDPSYRLIPLTKNQVTEVDVENYAELSQYCWQAHWSTDTLTFYAQRAGVGPDGKQVYISMHRQIMGITDPDIIVDHIDRNLTLNNRKVNLRVATRSQNGWNSKKRKNNRSGIKGVYLHAKNQKWIAQISINGKHKYLGSFATKEAACEVYEKAALEYYREFAYFDKDASAIIDENNLSPDNAPPDQPVK